MDQRGLESSGLPIERVLPALHAALMHHSSAVLQAPPGAGKTTRVPLSLLDAAWLGGQRIVMLEPRRLAARAAARRMAAMIGEPVGGLVGFRVRGETRVGSTTRIEVVTEGVLTRMLLSDPALEGAGLVIFDEFHERTVHADLGLALTLHSQSLLRPELRILIMSATLHGSSVSLLMGGAPIVTSEGREFPVAVRHVVWQERHRVEDAVARAVRSALGTEAGSILAFLPGGAEIRRCAATLSRHDLPPDVQLFSLYGDLGHAEQDRAIAPVPAGQRKVVLATSIAETSLTIEGIRVVVDSGYSRVSRFSPRTGMARLETVRVSRASADQRCGRAGRTAPGVCLRLWPVEESPHLPDHSAPEIVETDLAPLALDLAMAGISDPCELRWLDPPPAAVLSQARALLMRLGAVTSDLRITPHGREMSELGLHPRLAHMALSARALGHGATGCLIAALLQERDVFRRDSGHRDADLRSRIDAVVRSAGREGRDNLMENVDGDALRRVREQTRLWRRQLQIAEGESFDEHVAGDLIALAYPDRVAQLRAGVEHRYLLRNGSEAELVDVGALTGSPFLAVAELDGRSPRSRIYLAAPLERSSIDSLFGSELVREEVLSWDNSAGMVILERRLLLGAIVLHEARINQLDHGRTAQVLATAIEQGELALPWSRKAEQLRDRLAFLRTIDGRWPDVGEMALRASVHVWLLPHLYGLRTRRDVEKLDLSAILLGRLSWDDRRQLDELAPSHMEVPTGSMLPIDYGDPSGPALAVRIQELFGLSTSPSVGGGRVPLTLQLLSPAHRPVQVTRDLAGFWRSSYFAVRKDLRGRYPRHEWPEDPLHAEPTRRAKPRR